MKANELRVGNWVDFNGEKARIAQLREMEVIFKCGDSVLYSELSPVPLTEEILIKAGWKHYQEEDTECDSGSMDYYSLDRFTICNWGDGFILSTYMYMHHRIELKTVHQLQNLYFALTGEEIKIDVE